MRSTLLSALVLLTASSPAMAQPRAVIELFTSQGCSSCPPADRAMNSWAEQADVVALTMPVDYWDYLGWKDTLANHEFTVRQELVQCCYCLVFGGKHGQTMRLETRSDVGLRNRGHQWLACRLCEIR